MKQTDIRKKLSAIVARLAPLTPEGPSEQRWAFGLERNDLPLDSVLVLQLVLAIEAEFGVAVEDHDIGPENFGNLAGLCKFVESKLAASSAF